MKPDKLAVDDEVMAVLDRQINAPLVNGLVSRANYPCPACGRESKVHQGPDGEDPNNPIRICSNRNCRTVFEG